MKILITTLLFAGALYAQDGDRAKNFISKKDANKDGKLSADELGVGRHLFAVLDKNGDGFVTADEVQAPRRKRAGRDGMPREGMPGRLLERHDKDGDGKLSKAEMPEGGRMDFARTDANGDGFLDKAELKKAFAGSDRRRGPSPEQVRKMAESIVKRLDKDGDGKLNAEEIAAAKERGGKRPAGDRPAPDGKRGPGMRGRGPDLSKADTNGDGFVDVGEISKVVAQGRDRRRDDPRMLKKLIERMDANKDGKVEESEWKGRKQMFAQLDANSDKVVTAEEVEAAVQKMQRWRGRAGEAMFRRMDANQDGRLTKDEWKLDTAFERFDRNKDGFISADEVMLLGRRGRRGPDARSGKGSAHFLEKYDKNQDGAVDKDEFTHERRFAEMDADGNGSLSKAEIEEAMDKRMRESRLGFFERFDLNGDGKVTREEFTGPASDFESKDNNNDGIIDATDKPDGK